MTLPWFSGTATDLSRYLIKVLIGLLFVGTGSAKIIDPSATILSLNASLKFLPINLIVLIVCLLANLELLVGYLLLKRQCNLGINLALAVLLVFSCYLFYLTRFPVAPPCGCSSLALLLGDKGSDAKSGLVRNLAIIGLLAAIHKVQPTSIPLSDSDANIINSN